MKKGREGGGGEGQRRGGLRDYSLLCFTLPYDINAPTARTARVVPGTVVRKAGKVIRMLSRLYNVQGVPGVVAEAEQATILENIFLAMFYPNFTSSKRSSQLEFSNCKTKNIFFQINIDNMYNAFILSWDVYDHLFRLLRSTQFGKKNSIKFVVKITLK